MQSEDNVLLVLMMEPILKGINGGLRLPPALNALLTVLLLHPPMQLLQHSCQATALLRHLQLGPQMCEESPVRRELQLRHENRSQKLKIQEHGSAGGGTGGNIQKKKAQQGPTLLN